MPGTRRKWSRFKIGLMDGGVVVPRSLTPDPTTDFETSPATDLESIESMEDWIVTEDKWASLAWNPAVTVDTVSRTWVRYAEPSVSRKPTWARAAKIYAGWLKATFLPNVIDIHAGRHIAQAYHPKGADDRNKEWQVRLAGGDLAKQDAERIRLIAVCHALEAKVKAAKALAELEAIDWFSPGVWHPPAEDEE